MVETIPDLQTIAEKLIFTKEASKTCT